MNNSIDILKNIYKPYRIIKKGNCTIFETTSGNYVIKKRGNCNLNELYNYLLSRSFSAFPKLIDFSRNEVNVFEFIKEVATPSNQKALDLISLVALLHNKTSYYKEVTTDNYAEIRDNVLANIVDTKNYYDALFEAFLSNEFLSPSQYLFMRNFTIIKDSLSFCSSEIEKWYDMVKDEKRQRVVVVHNNLKLDHYIRNEDEYLISWDESVVDSPIVDLIKFYNEHYADLEFSSILTKYLDNFALNDSEMKLLFICISIPKKYVISTSEIETCTNVEKLLNYLFRTESLIRPYYSEEKEKE